MAPSATCPTCRASLVLTNHGAFDSWVCPAGHGLAATLSEVYERAQEDEITRLWALARHAAGNGQQGRACPMCSRSMVAVVAPYDADEAPEGTDGDTPDAGEVPVDVCVSDQVVWFDAGELDQLPADLPDPEPTAEEEAALAAIRRDFGDGLVAAAEAREGFTDRVADRIGRSPRALALLGQG